MITLKRKLNFFDLFKFNDSLVFNINQDHRCLITYVTVTLLFFFFQELVSFIH
jgi:hypothetical protein